MMSKAPNTASQQELLDTETVSAIAGGTLLRDGEMLQRGTMSTVADSFFWLTAPQRAFPRETPSATAVVCFSPIRWDSPRRRPQHLMSRCADGRRLFYVEQPVFSTGSSVWLDISERECGVWVAVPYLPEGMEGDDAAAACRSLLDELFAEFSIDQYILWYYSPEALGYSRHLRPAAMIYDRMNELAGSGIPEGAEAELIAAADLIFTESPISGPIENVSKIHLSPESVDRDHFKCARDTEDEPFEQASLPYPRIGYYGPIDERLDLNLITAAADARPDWQFVMIGSVENVDVSALRERQNVHLMEGREYQEIPYYMAGWNVAMLPYGPGEAAGNCGAATALEYLAAGRPVVATRDVLRTFGREKMLHIAETLAEFIMTASEAGMDDTPDTTVWLRKADRLLARTSWDRTWGRMIETVEALVGRRRIANSSRQMQHS